MTARVLKSSLAGLFLIGFCGAQATAEVVEAAALLRAGSIVRAGDVRVSAKTVPGGFEDASKVIGQEVVATVYPGHVLRPGDLRAPTMIDRNQIVEMTYRDRGLLLRSEGRALDRGALGDLVRVMNLASRETVTGRVVGPGSVDMSR